MSMSEFTDAYLAACKHRDEAHEAVISVCLHVVLLAKILRETPGNVMIVDIPGALGIARAGLSFNGSQWPTATAINNALAQYHQALGAVQAAWTNVRLRNEERGLAPPPSDPWAAMRNEMLSRANHPPR